MTTLSTLKEGTVIKGDHGFPSNEIPHWLDKKKFYEARKIFKKYFFSIFFAHLTGLIFTVHVPSIITTLLATKKSSTVLDIFRRYLSTLVHIKMWYEGDIWNPEDPAYKSIIFVRKTHNEVAKKLNAVKKQNQLSLSQYEMALTQYSFIGFIILYPKQIGMSCNEEDLECLVHFWRGIGYQLGIYDKYNICTNGLGECRKICREIVDEIFKPNIVRQREECSTMSQNIIRAMTIFVPCLSWEAMMKFWFEIIHIPIHFKAKKQQIFEYWLMRVTFKLIFFNTLIRLFFNNILRMTIKQTVAGKKQLEQQIAQSIDQV
ncbi:uncharacterized protein [Centruroides vittatus]|uniref:uncharacterized protein n=1 Tax=Centruroides vittatus TaxID=120091 RepID=UPI003510BD15